MGEPLKIMYMNPVASHPATDQLFATMARDYKLDESEVHMVALDKAEYGFSHIEYRSYEAMVTRAIILAARQAAREGFDAFVIGCFYDTAFHDAREISGDMAVTAPCMAATEIAASLANRFGVIVGRRKWVPQMRANVHEYGHAERLAGFFDVGLGVDDFQKDHDVTAARLIEAGRKAVEDHSAEALVLGCTMEIGFHKVLEEKLGVPVIDAAIAALKRAEYAAILKRQCGWKPGRKWSMEPPPESEIDRFNAFPAMTFGSRIVIPAGRG